MSSSISNVDLYEALKALVGERAARMAADVFQPARDLATTEDLMRFEVNLEAKILELRAEVFDRLAMSESRVMGRLWVMFVPLWIGVFGLIATLVVKG